MHLLQNGKLTPHFPSYGCIVTITNTVLNTNVVIVIIIVIINIIDITYAHVSSSVEHGVFAVDACC